MREQELYKEKLDENLVTIKKGDYVQLVACIEHELYCESAYEVISDPYKFGNSWAVDIKGIGPFDVAMLKKVVTDNDKNQTARN